MWLWAQVSGSPGKEQSRYVKSCNLGFKGCLRKSRSNGAHKRSHLQCQINQNNPDPRHEWPLDSLGFEEAVVSAQEVGK